MAKRSSKGTGEEERGTASKPRKRKANDSDTTAPMPAACHHFQTRSKPPATISLATGEPVHLSAAQLEQWASEAGGQRAACRGPEYDSVRLVGSTFLDLTTSAVSKAPRLLGLLTKPSKPRATEAKWGWNRKIGGVAPPSTPPIEAWDKASGEVVGQGFASPDAVLRALYDGELICEQPWAVEFIEAANTLTQPDPTLWGCPLIRCILVPPVEMPTPKPLGGGKRKAVGRAATAAAAAGEGSAADEEVSIRLQMHVYISRLLLYMIAHPSIRVIIERLSPPSKPRPIDCLPAYPPSFLSHGGAAAAPFSLEGVLKSVEHAGYRAEPQPPRLALTLKPYQQQALGWMLDMERLPRGINGLFWEERPFVDGGCFHYSPQLGEMRLAAPPVMHGGLLCDEMGLGKTLEIVGLVISTLEMPMDEAPEGTLPSRATLIVVPPTLVSQWVVEIRKSVGEHSTLRVEKYAQNDVIKKDAQGAWRAQAAELAANDIVITTYGALDKCSTALPTIAWKRVVLDEMQEVRSSTTELAKKCERLTAARRWMVSGTPLYDKISDLQGELYFLRVSPFGAGHEDGFWGHVIGRPWEAKSESALDALQVLMRGVMMRHSKSQTTLDGRSILSLPPKTITYQPVSLAASEVASYAYLEQLLVREIRRSQAIRSIGQPAPLGRSQGSGVVSNGAALLVTGLRLLREACVALQLLGGGAACSDQLKALEEICRARLRATAAVDGDGAPWLDSGADAVQLKRLTPSQAILHLGSSDREHTEKQQGDRFHNAGRAVDMVRHANTSNRVYDRARAYAVDKLTTKLEAALEKKTELEAIERVHARSSALCRWRWALERVTTGALLCTARPTAAADSLIGDEDEGTLAGLHADARARHEEAEARAAEEAEEEAAEAERQRHARWPPPRPDSKASRPPRRSCRFLWLYRGVYGAHRAATLQHAEQVLNVAEQSVRSPPLVRPKGKQPEGMLEFAPVSAAELEAGLAILSRPERLRSDVRTQQDAEFNRDLTRGRLRGSPSGSPVVVEVLNTIDADDPADGSFIQIAACESRHVPQGWVHNKPRIDPRKLGEICRRMGMAVSISQLADDAIYRSQIMKDVFREQRAERDRCKLLSASMPALLAMPALRAFGRSDTLRTVGGPTVLAEAHRLAQAGAVTSAAELQAKVYLAIAQAVNTAPTIEPEARAKLTEALGKDFRSNVERVANVFAPIGWRPTAQLYAQLRAAHPEWKWLQQSAVVMRGLPELATPDDLTASLRPFARSAMPAETGSSASLVECHRLSARYPIVCMGGRSGEAFVEFAHEDDAKTLLDVAARSSGVSITLAGEVGMWRERLEAAQIEFDAVASDYEAAKAAEAEAEAAIGAKRESLGSAIAWKRFEKTSACRDLKKAKAAASAVLTKPGEDGAESLSKRYHEARRKLDKARAGRRACQSGREPDGGCISLEGCGKFKEEFRRKFSAELSAELLASIRQSEVEVADVRVKLAELRPYVDKLRAAAARGLDAEMVEQAGFQELFALERGQPTSATCPICYEGVGSSGPIVVTPCAHLFCRQCMLSWINAQNVMVSVAQRQGTDLATKLCPCCRHPFSLATLLEIAPDASNDEEGKASSSTAPVPSAGDAGGSSSRTGTSSAASNKSIDSANRVPAYSPAYTAKAFEAMPPPSERDRQVRVGRCPSIPPALLGHMQAATGIPPGSTARIGSSLCLDPASAAAVSQPQESGVASASSAAPPLPLGTVVPSAKIQQLLADLSALGCDAEGAPLKSVVFSQHRSAVKHLDWVLSQANVPHVTICKGDQQGTQESAVATWTTRPSCRVFLLHAGAAAAGLTLVAAQHVFLLEPFDKPGQELQALNRCHRIGQAKPVSCTIYYAERTVEERLLAFRSLEQQQCPEVSAELAAGGEAEAITLLAEGAALPSRSKLRFIFGMLRHRGNAAEEDEVEDADDEAADDEDAEVAESEEEDDEDDYDEVMMEDDEDDEDDDGEDEGEDKEDEDEDEIDCVVIDSDAE